MWALKWKRKLQLPFLPQRVTVRIQWDSAGDSALQTWLNKWKMFLSPVEFGLPTSASNNENSLSLGVQKSILKYSCSYLIFFCHEHSGLFIILQRSYEAAFICHCLLSLPLVIPYKISPNRVLTQKVSWVEQVGSMTGIYTYCLPDEDPEAAYTATN